MYVCFVLFILKCIFAILIIEICYVKINFDTYNTKFNYIVRRPKPPAKKSTPSPIRRSPQVKQSSVRRSPTKNTQCLAITKTTNKRCSRKICSGCSKYCKTHSKMSK